MRLTTHNLHRIVSEWALLAGSETAVTERRDRAWCRQDTILAEVRV